MNKMSGILNRDAQLLAQGLYRKAKSERRRNASFWNDMYDDSPIPSGFPDIRVSPRVGKEYQVDSIPPVRSRDCVNVSLVTKEHGKSSRVD